jgi:thiamine-phosphate pyrophosphorylase
LCDAVVKAGSSYGAVVIVNDRADLAGMAGAAGVHVGQDDLPPKLARQLLGRDAIIGCSTHTVSQMDAVLREPISYMAVGPVFATHTKDTGYQAVGLQLVSTAARLARPMPVVAIGGVTLQNAKSVIDAGAACVAVVTDLLASNDPSARTMAYLQSLAQHRV